MRGVKRKRKIDDQEIERALQEDSEIDCEDDDDTKEEAENTDDVVSVEPSPSTSSVTFLGIRLEM